VARPAGGSAVAGGYARRSRSGSCDHGVRTPGGEAGGRAVGAAGVPPAAVVPPAAGAPGCGTRVGGDDAPGGIVGLDGSGAAGRAAGCCAPTGGRGEAGNRGCPWEGPASGTPLVKRGEA
jgi:hypothetical protein